MPETFVVDVGTVDSMVTGFESNVAGTSTSISESFVVEAGSGDFGGVADPESLLTREPAAPSRRLPLTNSIVVDSCTLDIGGVDCVCCGSRDAESLLTTRDSEAAVPLSVNEVDLEWDIGNKKEVSLPWLVIELLIMLVSLFSAFVPVAVDVLLILIMLSDWTCDMILLTLPCS